MNYALKVTILFILYNLLYNIINNNTIYSISISSRIRNYGLRFVVFREKKLGKFLKKILYVKENYYNKTIICTANAINEYNTKFTEDEKIIIETILSLCY